MSEYRHELSNVSEVLEKNNLNRVVVLITFDAKVEIENINDYKLYIENESIKVLQNNNGINIEALYNFQSQITGLCKRYCKIFNYHFKKGTIQRQFELELFEVCKHKEEWDRPEYMYLIGGFKRRLHLF